MVHLGGGGAWPLPESASSAAFCMTARGAVSPVQISNWRTACSMNMSRPGTTVLPCSLARLHQHGFERVVHHVEDDVGGNLAVEEALVDVREHAERRGVHHGVEVAANRAVRAAAASAPQILAQGAHAVGIAAHQGDFGAGIGERAGRAAGRAAVAHDQHRGVGKLQQAGERTGDAGGVGIGAAPLAGLAPDRVDRADAARQRVHHVQVADDLLLVRNGDAEAGERQLGGQREEIAQACRARPGTAGRPHPRAAIERRGCARRAKWSGAPGRRSRRRSWPILPSFSTR